MRLRLNNLPKITHRISSKARIWVQAIWFQSLLWTKKSWKVPVLGQYPSDSFLLFACSPYACFFHIPLLTHLLEFDQWKALVESRKMGRREKEKILRSSCCRQPLDSGIQLLLGWASLVLSSAMWPWLPWTFCFSLSARASTTSCC